MITAIRFLSELRNKTRQFAFFLHFGEFPFELSAVISKCDFVISDTIFQLKEKWNVQGSSQADLFSVKREM